jgi:hypothetical protein
MSIYVELQSISTLLVKNNAIKSVNGIHCIMYYT